MKQAWLQTDSADKVGRRPLLKRRQLERDIEHITAEMYRRNKDLAETNKTLSLISTIDAMALEPHASLKMVCEHITEAIGQATNYPITALFTRVSRNKDEVELRGVSSAGLGKQLPDDLSLSRPLRVQITHPWFSDFARSRLINFSSETEQDLTDYLNCSLSEIQKLQDKTGIKSLYVVKLTSRRQIVGLLAVGYLLPKEQISKDDIKLLDHLSESVGVAVDNKLLFDENQRVLRQLKESNAKLLALDEAKDDFISMASHQLRTPLTSVKGYISMLMEGDAGKLSDQQSKLLGQALSSSQRMVYIISDLLNVSRLRTGKFVMDTTPVNLAEIIEQELDQLQLTASIHGLNLIYKKPQQFPELMLDDTKTRQVIMNFVDNAIYYTPPKGKITVSLEDKPSSIELRVTDTGIGVPRHEQAHLFSKFYRAPNARKARPDGTGLGLFMAKKIIVSQHGSLIFESKEGKGSTFGFILNKSLLPKSSNSTLTT